LSVEDMLRQCIPNLDWSYLNPDGWQWLLSKQAKEVFIRPRRIAVNGC
jgi:hypothetical protein